MFSENGVPTPLPFFVNAIAPAGNDLVRRPRARARTYGSYMQPLFPSLSTSRACIRMPRSTATALGVSSDKKSRRREDLCVQNAFFKQRRARSICPDELHARVRSDIDVFRYLRPEPAPANGVGFEKFPNRELSASKELPIFGAPQRLDIHTKADRFERPMFSLAERSNFWPKLGNCESGGRKI